MQPLRSLINPLALKRKGRVVVKWAVGRSSAVGLALAESCYSAPYVSFQHQEVGRLELSNWKETVISLSKGQCP